MNICNNMIADITVRSKQIGIFSDPIRDSYFGKYIETVIGEYKTDKWSHYNDDNVIYDSWISFTRRDFKSSKR